MTREIKNYDFGEWMKEKRKEAGMTQVEFADKLGVYQNAVSHWETGRSDPYFSDAERIVRLFGAELVIREHRKERERDEG